MSLPPGTLVGKYIVQRKLAEGGMAEVYLATAQGAEGFEKPVVIKRIRSGLAHDASFVEMFIAEAHLASRLSHPNLVHIFDFDRHEDTYYLAMEYIRGRSLVEAHKRASELSTPVPAVLVAQIGVEVARGLGYAHKLSDHGKPLNLVHRDVTPHNILLSYDGAVKLTDFGIAKAGGRATTVGMLKGKFAYMAPEQARGDPVDARTDLFALGITLWELLTGGRLFDGDTDLAVLRAVQERPVLAPADLNPDVDDELSLVVVKALQRAPADRYQTAAEFERALLQYVLRHSQVPEDTDVGAFVRDLFPVEAERGESTIGVQPSRPPWPPRDGSAATVLHAEAMSKREPMGSPMPAELLTKEGPGGSRTRLFDSSAPSAAERQTASQGASGRGGTQADEGPTLRRRAPVNVRRAAWALADAVTERLRALEVAAGGAVAKVTGARPSRAILVVGGVALLSTLVSIVLAVVLSRPAVPSVRPVEPKPAALELGNPEPLPAPEAKGPVEAPPALPLPPAAQAPAADEGYLELTLTPSGSVSIDGKEPTLVQGTQLFTLKTGRHEVTATDSKVITGWSVYLRPGVTVKKHFTFRKHK